MQRSIRRISRSVCNQTKRFRVRRLLFTHDFRIYLLKSNFRAIQEEHAAFTPTQVPMAQVAFLNHTIISMLTLMLIFILKFIKSNQPGPLKAVAINDFIATKSNHLGFKQGDVITLREQKDLWWSGELNGRVRPKTKEFWFLLLFVFFI